MLHIHFIWHHHRHPHFTVSSATLQPLAFKTIPSSVFLSSFRLPLCDRWAIFAVIEYQEKRVKVIRLAYFLKKYYYKFVYQKKLPAILN